MRALFSPALRRACANESGAMLRPDRGSVVVVGSSERQRWARGRGEQLPAPAGEDERQPSQGCARRVRETCAPPEKKTFNEPDRSDVK